MPIRRVKSLRTRIAVVVGGSMFLLLAALLAIYGIVTGSRRKCLEAGMNDFLTKPVRLADIESCLERWKQRVQAL